MGITHHVHCYWRRHFAALFRVLHVNLSMVSFAILFFFAAMGLTIPCHPPRGSALYSMACGLCRPMMMT